MADFVVISMVAIWWLLIKRGIRHQMMHHQNSAGSDKLSQMRIYISLHNQLKSNQLRKKLVTAANIAAIGTLGAAGICALDIFVANSGIPNSVLETILETYSDANSLIFDYAQKSQFVSGNFTDYLKWVMSGGMLFFGGASLIAWGVSNRRAQKGLRKEKLMESVFSVPHDSQESELEMYMALSGKPKSGWGPDKEYFYRNILTWLKVGELAEYVKNSRIIDKIQDDAINHVISGRPSLSEIISGIERRTGRNIELGKEVARASFGLPIQLNQRQCYFEGYVFDTISGAEEFSGLEVLFSRLSDGRWVVGSIGSEKPKPKNVRKKALEDMIKSEILYPFFYAKPEGDSLSIAIVSEGTYPFERGGVATVIDDLVKTLKPDYFDGRNVFYEIVSMMANPGPFYPKISFSFPSNVHFNRPIAIWGYDGNNPHFILNEEPASPAFFPRIEWRKRCKEAGKGAEVKKIIHQLEDAISSKDFSLFFDAAEKISKYSVEDVVRSSFALEAVREIYHETAKKGRPSFIDFFYHWHSLRKPLIRVIKSDKVKADLYYAVVAGLGGVYSALASRQFGVPMVLTEHGIYQEDRLIDIANSPVSPFFKALWKDTMKFYSLLSYESAETITTLCQSNLDKQHRDGADPRKTIILPNALRTFGGDVLVPYSDKLNSNTYTVGLLGNVQKVKQPELFILIADYLRSAFPEIEWQFHIMGRDDIHEKDYASLIHSIVSRLKLDDILHFSPYSNWREAYSKLDCGVITSASEVQSRAVMEILSLGIPVIAPDIGGNRELIYGKGVDSLGAAGILIEAASPENLVRETANAILALAARKQRMLSGSVSINPHCLNGYYSMLNSQEKPIEEVGPARIQASFDELVVAPRYAHAFREVLGV